MVRIKKGNAMQEMFDKFWSEYPRKAKKGAARRAFDKAIKLVDFSVMLEAVQRYAREVNGRAMRFIMLPATWLNGECWEDEAGANDESKVYSVATPRVSDEQVWRDRLKNYRPGGFWSPSWGSKPEHGGTDIPKHLLTEWQRSQERVA